MLTTAPPLHTDDGAIHEDDGAVHEDDCAVQHNFLIFCFKKSEEKKELEKNQKNYKQKENIPDI